MQPHLQLLERNASKGATAVREVWLVASAERGGGSPDFSVFYFSIIRTENRKNRKQKL
jgi:hypothetical protein